MNLALTLIIAGLATMAAGLVCWILGGILQSLGSPPPRKDRD